MTPENAQLEKRLIQNRVWKLEVAWTSELSGGTYLTIRDLAWLPQFLQSLEVSSDYGDDIQSHASGDLCQRS